MGSEIIVRIFQDGNEICALIGPDLMAGTAGFGPTMGAALRSLADQVDSQGYRTSEISEEAA